MSDYAPLPRLKTRGNQLVTDDENENIVVLRSVSWFGAESDVFIPHGLWVRNWRDLADQLISMGFNCVRIPFSGDTHQAKGLSAGIDISQNLDFDGKDPIDVLDTIIEYFNDRHIYVVLDHHRKREGIGADGSPFDSNYIKQDWIDTWKFYANRYKDLPCVLGADLHNEPHEFTWNEWATHSEDCANEIHVIAPDWLIFIEGVGNGIEGNYWWGGYLAEVRTRPRVLNRIKIKTPRVVVPEYKLGEDRQYSQLRLEVSFDDYQEAIKGKIILRNLSVIKNPTYDYTP